MASTTLLACLPLLFCHGTLGVFSVCGQAEQAVNEKNFNLKKEKADAERKSKEKRARQLSEDIEKKKNRLNAKSAGILRLRAESKRTFEVAFVALALSIFGLGVVPASILHIGLLPNGVPSLYGPRTESGDSSLVECTRRVCPNVAAESQ